MNTRQTGSFGRSLLRLFLPLGLASLLALAFAVPLRAQGIGGTVTGLVSDSATGKYLEGAEVALKGTAFQTTTERDGTFALKNVPPGNYSLTVAYPSSELETLALTLTSGQTLNVPVKLTSQVFKMAE